MLVCGYVIITAQRITIVLPQPTSPIISRLAAILESKSKLISFMAEHCPLVREKGKDSIKGVISLLQRYLALKCIFLRESKCK